MTSVLPGTLIDRSFRERIILVGVIFPGLSAEAVDDALDELAQLVDLSLIHIFDITRRPRIGNPP